MITSMSWRRPGASSSAWASWNSCSLPGAWPPARCIPRCWRRLRRSGPRAVRRGSEAQVGTAERRTSWWQLVPRRPNSMGSCVMLLLVSFVWSTYDWLPFCRDGEVAHSNKTKNVSGAPRNLATKLGWKQQMFGHLQTSKGIWNTTHAGCDLGDLLKASIWLLPKHMALPQTCLPLQRLSLLDSWMTHSDTHCLLCDQKAFKSEQKWPLGTPEWW